MSVNKKQISIGVFEKKYCGVCGIEYINQFYNAYESYIEYCEEFHSLIDILKESLDLKIDHNAGKTMEICFDCKDKVIKFYHFKRKVKEVQMQQQKMIIQHDKQKNSQKTNKVVHNIYKIIENYTEKCSVTAIRVDEESKKLIIHANEVNNVKEQPIIIKQEPESQIFDSTNEFEEEQFEGSIFSEDLSTIYNSETESVIMIKEEPLEVDEVQILPPLPTTSNFSSVPVARKKTSQPIIKEISSSNTNHLIPINQRNRRSEKPISAAAIKMRLYREKLKKPENREKYLQHQLKQKEWNRQYYQRKQMKDMDMDFMY
ncbi:hypothetical protein PVAND_001560 [Polypedilum vanderplanki]|uniref:ZAD domain-containing protein n=1 Tax=Polypedilum vanderplanki TaxID=319348 RepID=A0A9J6BNR9_POLVA|nr:hypothetical protein PVAND_001560 [Polypedilum vanderplanki]